MIISHKYRFIFVKVPKTAGTSIQVALAKHCGPDDVLTPIRPHEPAWGDYEPRNFEGWHSHSSARKIRTKLRKLWREYYTFAFDRNPWDRMVSEYWFRHSVGHVETFAEWMTRDIPAPNHWMYTSQDQKIVNFIGRYESLQADYNTICAQIGIPAETLPKLKAGCRTDQKHYTEYYDEYLKAMVQARCGWAIDNLGYQFGE